MGKVKTVSLKFKGQRKAQDYVVYPKSQGDEGRLTFQSDKAIGRVDPTTKVCIYQPGSPYALGHKECQRFVMDQADFDAIAEAQAKSGDTMGGGVCVIA
jgi:hypothetical protein